MLKVSFWRIICTYHEGWKQVRKRNEDCHSLCSSGVIAINRWYWRKNNEQIRGHIFFQMLGQIFPSSLILKITLEVWAPVFHGAGRQ